MIKGLFKQIGQTAQRRKRRAKRYPHRAVCRWLGQGPLCIGDYFGDNVGTVRSISSSQAQLQGHPRGGRGLPGAKTDRTFISRIHGIAEHFAKGLDMVVEYIVYSRSLKRAPCCLRSNICLLYASPGLSTKTWQTASSVTGLLPVSLN